MKLIQITKLCVLLSLGIVSFTYAKGGGNGGGVHYCPANIEQEFYDLYEGVERYDLELVKKDLNLEGWLNFALSRIYQESPSIARDVKKQLNRITSKENSILVDKTGRNLKFTADADILFVNEGCDYKQLANWDEFDSLNERIFYHKNIFDMMNDMNKAAFFIHEALYKVARIRVNEVDSNRVRKNNAEIFSTKSSIDLNWLKKSTDIEFESFDFIGKKRILAEGAEFKALWGISSIRTYGIWSTNDYIRLLALKLNSEKLVLKETMATLKVSLSIESREAYLAKYYDKKISEIEHSDYSKRKKTKLIRKLVAKKNDVHLFIKETSIDLVCRDNNVQVGNKVNLNYLNRNTVIEIKQNMLCDVQLAKPMIQGLGINFEMKLNDDQETSFNWSEAYYQSGYYDHLDPELNQIKGPLTRGFEIQVITEEKK